MRVSFTSDKNMRNVETDVLSRLPGRDGMWRLTGVWDYRRFAPMNRPLFTIEYTRINKDGSVHRSSHRLYFETNDGRCAESTRAIQMIHDGKVGY